MYRNLYQQKAFVCRIVLAIGLTAAYGRADAQVKPLKITGGGTAPDGISLIPLTPVPHPTTGNATELGRYTGLGFFQILNFTGPLTAKFSSAPDVAFVAANGDKLVMTYGVVANGAAQPGQVTLPPNADGSGMRRVRAPRPRKTSRTFMRRSSAFPESSSGDLSIYEYNLN